jgi:F-type H+-transporting ATPase subunit b
MDLVTPGFGLVFWTTLTFIILLVILGKTAWPAITKAIAKREAYIADSIKKADEVNAQLEGIKEDRKATLATAKEEANEILKEVKQLKDKLLLEAIDQAKAESNKIIEDAKATIEQEKEKALKGIKNQVALISIEIAGKVLKKSLESDKAQQEYVNTLLDDINALKN